MAKIVELEKQLMQRNKELDVIRVSGMGSPGWIQDTGSGDHGSGAGEFSWFPNLEPGADFRWNYLCVHSKDGHKSLWMCQEALSEMDTSHCPRLEHSRWEFWTCAGPKGWENLGFLRRGCPGHMQCNPLSGSGCSAPGLGILNAHSLCLHHSRRSTRMQTRRSTP